MTLGTYRHLQSDELAPYRERPFARGEQVKALHGLALHLPGSTRPAILLWTEGPGEPGFENLVFTFVPDPHDLSVATREDLQTLLLLESDSIVDALAYLALHARETT